MRTEEYPVKSYRLHPDTSIKIKELTKTTGLSYNLLFKEMIEVYSGYQRINKNIRRG